ncbi:MAG: hypothetical protein HY062_16735 [Bacteroidetes bacterium]|nr:hypothetical protein [Bacteroidota bacterium]
MKKIMIIAIVATASTFVACKKERTCTCTYNNSGSSNTYTEITTYDKTSKKVARNSCTSGKSYDQAHPADIQTRVCDLK